MVKYARIMALAFIFITLAGFVWFTVAAIGNKNSLPVIGEPGHVAGNFHFTNQKGQTFTQEDVKGKVTVAEYFFTTCSGICKIMNRNLSTVHRKFKDHSEFIILSHTVDPVTDSVSVLAEYATKVGASGPGWQFLTGDKMALYDAARIDYLLAVEDKSAQSIEEDFIHTEYVALLDRQRRIRGFYDATDSTSTAIMMEDIQKLLEDR
jgi:protein SCO1/2